MTGVPRATTTSHPTVVRPRSPGRRARRGGPLTVVAVTIVALTVLLGGVAAAQTDETLRLEPGPLTDEVGAIRDRTATLAALDELVSETGVQLTAVFVASFDGVDAVAWADDVAVANGFGVRDVLLAIAVEDRIYAPLNVDADFALSDAELDAIAFEFLEPQLRDSDWDGAVIATAGGLCAALGGDCALTPARAAGATAPDRDGGSDSGSGGGLLVWIVVAGVIGSLVALILRARRGNSTTSRGTAAATVGPDGDELDTLDLAALRSRAGGLLVALDDAIRDGDQEAAFAELEFGPVAVTDFRAALDGARSVLSEAFAANQQLSAAPDGTDEASLRAGYRDLVRRGEAARAALDAEAATFEALRDQRSRIPETVTALTGRLSEAERTAPSLTAIIEELTAGYAPAAIAPVERNVAEVETRLALAAEALTGVADAQAVDDDNAAVVALRDAEAAVAQAEQLIAAVQSARTELATADRALDGALGRLRSDLDELAGSDASRGELAPAIAAAQVALDETTAARAAGDLDPVAAMARIAAVSVPLEQALAHEQQLRTTFDGLSQAATARIQAVEGFIHTRRGAVGPDARTRLAEASAALRQAQQLRETDLAQAVGYAQHAQQLADQAGRAAERDVRAYQPPPAPPIYDTRSHSRAMTRGAITGAAIGGIAGSTRRRHHGSDWGGGSNWGGGSPGFGGGTTGRGTGGAARSTGGTTRRSSGGSTGRSTGGSTGRSTGGTTRRSSGGSTGRSSGGGRRGGGGGRF